MVPKNIGSVERRLLFHFHEFEKEIKRKNIHTPPGNNEGKRYG